MLHRQKHETLDYYTVLSAVTDVIHFKSQNRKIAVFKREVIAIKLRSLRFYPHMAYLTPLVKLRFSLTLATRGFT